MKVGDFVRIIDDDLIPHYVGLLGRIINMGVRSTHYPITVRFLTGRTKGFSNVFNSEQLADVSREDAMVELL